jgi:replicative DNA helicase
MFPMSAFGTGTCQNGKADGLPMWRRNCASSRSPSMARNGQSLDLVVIDHMHRMQQPGTRSDVEKYSEISARLAEMAKRLNCPVLTLAQLNRGLESRDDKRPQLSDLRASGSIEQDADVALFVHRPAYHLSRERHTDMNREAERLTDLQAVENVFEIIIEKQRNGPIGTIELWCDMANNVIRDRADVRALGLEDAA